MGGRIKRAAVLGSGVMGSGIAAQLSGAGVPVLLLDMIPPAPPEPERRRAKGGPKASRSSLAEAGLQRALQARPPLFYDPGDASLIEVGNFQDDLGRLAECDWVIEAVTEDLGIKQRLFAEVDRTRRPGALITSNTSGLGIRDMVRDRSEDFTKHFFVTHFFNPVRHMHLLELVAGEHTDGEALQRLARFASDRLGKGIVYAKDTPNFIANRIGVFSMMLALQAMLRDGLSVEEVDAVFGRPTGRPKSAILRTADMVGLDTLCHVADHCYASLEHDEQREVFRVPELLREMVRRGLLGDKSGGGFYQRTKTGKGKSRMTGQGHAGETLVLDLAQLTYRPARSVRADALDVAQRLVDPGERVRAVIASDDALGRLAWEVTSRTLVYSANRLGEIADDVVNCDRAMRWGFNWDLGPFETWDAVGLAPSLERLEREGVPAPVRVEAMLQHGASSFYGGTAARPSYFDFPSVGYRDVPLNERQLRLAALRESHIVNENPSATLYDAADGILLLEFHTKMNTVDADLVSMLDEAVELAEDQGWLGLVVGNESPTAFSAGANLRPLLGWIKEKNWDAIERMITALQQSTWRLRHSQVPVVAAPAGLALGGGAEIVMGAARVQAHAELYLGLVEVGVGLIPAGGGILETLERACSALPDDPALDPLPLLRVAFQNIATGRVSTSAEDARRLALLRPDDGVTLNRDYLLHDAKQAALGLARAGYRPPRPAGFRLPGADGAAAFRATLENLRQAHQISEHDQLIGAKLARVLCGGDTTTRLRTPPEQILQLEREAFLSLCGERKTMERIEHMLETGKPLRN